jgi:Xaa-Pro aminopeptidase
MTQSPSKNSAEKLSLLRKAMKDYNIQGYMVPRADEFQGEYVPARAERLQYMTNFTGSAGHAVMLMNHAMVMSDGRYTIQMEQQIDSALFDLCNISRGDDTIKWIAKHAKKGDIIGYDPRVMTIGEANRYRQNLKNAGIEFLPVNENLIDAIWADQPAAPLDLVTIFPENIAGKNSSDKRQEIAAQIKEQGGAGFVMTMPDSVAWMLNIRGEDVPHVPVALSYVIIKDDGQVDLFIPPAKITQEVRKHLGNEVAVRDPSELSQGLKELAQYANSKNAPVLMDLAVTGEWFKNELKSHGAELKPLKDPCALPRAIKTKAEQDSIRDVHVRDGVAVTKFLRWVDENANKGDVTELDIEKTLLDFRRLDKDCIDTSFDTIAGWAANGAIVHYRATNETAATISGDNLLLVDSGGQYKNAGTTDITRTIAVGDVTEEMKFTNTLVLKGHIAVATARFPEGTKGSAIDALARKALWKAGLDYDHGTGHGVGCYLSVHEEACSISAREGGLPFHAGMLISNEPGFYKAGSFGIRIENLILVREDGVREGSNKKMLAFETVTLAPIDTRLIEAKLLEDSEIEWLNHYHARVEKTLSPHLDDETKKWLAKACAPLPAPKP